MKRDEKLQMKREIHERESKKGDEPGKGPIQQLPSAAPEGGKKYINAHRKKKY